MNVAATVLLTLMANRRAPHLPDTALPISIIAQWAGIICQ
jgi:hypothetical protein